MATTTIRSSSQLYIDANLNFNNNKGISLVAGTASGHAVEYDQMNTAISNAVSGVGNSIHVPVADLTGAVAVTNYLDRMIMLIETLGLYRYDAESAATSNNDTVIRPTNIASDASPGRWIKMSSTITDHNLLSNLQGGTTGQYNHLTNAQVALLSGAALTKTDDTNVTLTLGGSPTTALLTAASITVGWTGTLADARIASAATWNSKQAGHANLTSLSALTYVSTSFVKMTAAGTFALDTNTYLTTVTAHNLLSAIHGDTTAATVSRGDLITGQLASAKWQRLALPATPSGKILTNDGADVTWSTNALTIGASASISGSNTGDVTLATNSGLAFTSGQTGLALGTPTTITSSSINEVATSTHSHAITASLGFIGNGTAQYQTLVTGSTPFAPVWTTSINLFGTNGLNALTYAAASFVKMTGSNTFSLDTNTYQVVGATPTSHALESHTATVTAGKILRGSGANTFAWSTLTIPDTITALSTLVSNAANTLVVVAAVAGQSVRVNAGGTAWEAYTPLAITPAALTKTDDTNVTLTLGGTPTTALLQATSITVGWTGTLADGRIASAANWNSKQAGHANLTSLSGLTHVSASFVKMTGTNTFSLDTNVYLTTNQTITLSGDVSGSGTTAITTAIGANKVTLAMMAQVATQTFLGRTTAATGNVEALTVTQAKSMLGVVARSYRVVPTGTINGSNTAFTIAALIVSGTEEVYKNGMLMNAGVGNDYTISYGATTTITFATAPSSTPFADIILVNYSV